MTILGLILILVGFLFGIGILVPVGIVVLIVGLVLVVLANTGSSVSRRHYW